MIIVAVMFLAGGIVATLVSGMGGRELAESLAAALSVCFRLF